MKNFKLTAKAALCLLLVFGTAQNAVSQVTIGSVNVPHSAALLDLNQGLAVGDNENISDKGLLLPRVALESLTSFAPLGADADGIAGMVVYNITANDYLTPGLYIFDGVRWRKLLASDANWFFMPTIAIDMALTTGTAPHTVNLWDKFRQQFTSVATGGRLIASEDAPLEFLSTVVERKATDFWFYVTTSNDEEPVFGDIKIYPDGRMTYEIIGIPTDETFMNIIFVEKN